MIKRDKQLVLNGISLPILKNLGVGIKESSFSVKNSFGCAGRLVVTAITKSSGVQRTQSLTVSTGNMKDELTLMPFIGVGETKLKVEWQVNGLHIEKFYHTCKLPQGPYELGVTPFYDETLLRLGLIVKVYVGQTVLASFKIYPIHGMFIRSELSVTTSRDKVSTEVIRFIGDVMPAKRGVPLSPTDVSRLAKSATLRPHVMREESSKAYQAIIKLSKDFEPTLANYRKLGELYTQLFKSIKKDYEVIHSEESVSI